jgi:hypothetical protein
VISWSVRKEAKPSGAFSQRPHLILSGRCGLSGLISRSWLLRCPYRGERLLEQILLPSGLSLLRVPGVLGENPPLFSCRCSGPRCDVALQVGDAYEEIVCLRSR